MHTDFDTKRKEWIFHEYYGMGGAPSAADCVGYGKALLCCVNGDGELAPAERAWVMGFSATNGVPEDLVEQLRDYGGDGDVRAIMAGTELLGHVKPALIYDAIRACEADGTYADGEARAIRKMAAELGLSDGDVARIEGVWAPERDARARRIALLFPAGDTRIHTAPTSFNELKRGWIMREYYGIQSPPVAADLIAYAKILLCIANGDGELSAAERDWVLWFSAANNVPEAALEELRSYPGTDAIESLLTPALRTMSRALVFDAIRAAGADDEYSSAERATVRKMAAHLGVSADIVSQIEDAWFAEKAARQARIAAVVPAPFLAPVRGKA